MALAITISLLIFVWYGMKAVKENPARPNWSKAFVTTIFWPLSLLFKRYR